MKWTHNYKFLPIPKTDLLLIVATLVLLLSFIPVFTYIIFSPDLATKERLMNRNDTGVILLDRNDKPFFSFYQAKNKRFTALANLPLYTPEAVVAIEGKDFYSHSGFSLKSIIRSLVRDIKEGKLAYGGSTITQQLVKNSLLNPKKDFLRKYQEFILANEVEKNFSKQEILEMYLNSVYYGKGAFGVSQAAEAYFGKDPKDLTLAESALLAAILPAPSLLNPIYGDVDAARARQRVVLNKMLEQGYITPEEKEQASNEQINFKGIESMNTTAPHFALFVKSQLVKQYGEEAVSRSGFKVKTSLDLSWQDFAEKVVESQINKLEPNRVQNGAVVVIEPKTGEVRALVGSKDWNNDIYGKVDVVTSLRQPGSAFKPIVYAAAFENRIITPATILNDSPTNFVGNYKPENFDHRTRGKVTARRALANSLNIPSVEVISKVGVSKVVETAQKFGITSLQDPANYGLSLGLGAGEVKLLELTNAYSVFANNGIGQDTVTILEIKDKQGNVIFQHQPSERRVISQETAFLINSILSDTGTRSEIFGNVLNISRPAAVKTGTSQYFRDSWTIGYSPNLVIGVWVGNNDATSMNQVAGALGAAPIWKSLMEKYLSGLPVENFSKPQGVITATVCRYNGLLAKNSQVSSYTEYFLSGTQPNKTCIPPSPPPIETAMNPVKEQKTVQITQDSSTSQPSVSSQ